MYKLKVLNKLTEVGLFDIAKAIHNYFPEVSTERINNLILQVDSVDVALHILSVTRDNDFTINEAVFCVLQHKEAKNKGA